MSDKTERIVEDILESLHELDCTPMDLVNIADHIKMTGMVALMDQRIDFEFIARKGE